MRQYVTVQRNSDRIVAHLLQGALRHAYHCPLDGKTLSLQRFLDIGVSNRTEQLAVHSRFLADLDHQSIQLGCLSLCGCQNIFLGFFQFRTFRFELGYRRLRCPLCLSLGIRKFRA